MHKYFVYHENNTKKPYLPQEDYFTCKENVFVVADGITHDLNGNGLYPQPSPSYEVARIVCETLVKNLTPKHTKEEILEAFIEANEEVQKFQEKSSVYKNREDNGYTIGAVTVAVGLIDGDLFKYAVLDDCYVSIFGEDLIDHPILKANVDISAKHFDSKHDWKLPEHRKVWRKDYRNNTVTDGENKYGYGAIDGRNGFERFLQQGEEKLNKGDLICVYSDGFIKPLADKEFVRMIKDQEMSMELIESVADCMREKELVKEKTCYFIKYA